ncbi:MAG: ribosomal protein S18-alanine N-acetyltransferase [Bacillota bacterium]|nr:ribosomal protein S18-alanine N-acetyltransferase [Bacillota bacterium]
MTIVFVCTGNTCRSPMAEGIFKKLILPFKDEFTVKSVGISTFNGNPASENAVLACNEIDVDISSHRSTLITNEILNEADLFVALSKNHRDMLLSVGIPAERVHTLGGGIDDPYFCELDVYRACRDQIFEGCRLLLKQLISIKIVPFEEKHINELCEIEKLSFSQPWSAEGFKSELQNDTAHFYVAEVFGKVAGYIGAHFVCGEGYIANIAVSPNYRGLGIGSALLDCLVQFAKLQKLSFLTLEVRQSNIAAINLYKSFGFIDAGIRKNFYSNPTEDANIMTLIVN